MDTKYFLERLKEFCEKRLSVIRQKEDGGQHYTWQLYSNENSAPCFINVSELSSDEREVISFMSDYNMGSWVYGKQVILQEEFVKKDKK